MKHGPVLVLADGETRTRAINKVLGREPRRRKDCRDCAFRDKRHRRTEGARPVKLLGLALHRAALENA